MLLDVAGLRKSFGSIVVADDLDLAVAAGEAVGTLALFEGAGNPSPKAVKLTASGGTLNGVKKPVPDGAIADFAVVAARTGSAPLVAARHELRSRPSRSLSGILRTHSS